MKQILLILLAFSICMQVATAQSIKLEVPENGGSLTFCPNAQTRLTFSGRDMFNNKLAGKFRFRIFVDGVLLNDSDHQFGFPIGNTGTWDVIHYVNSTFNTGANNKLTFDFINYDQQSMHWTNGFALQSNNIVIEVKFSRNYSPFWVTRSFTLRTAVKEPGPAVINGTDDLFFCTPNEVKIVKLKSPPSRNTANSNNCFWNNNWVWELPTGWKITSTTGDLTTATNTFTTDADIVKIQAPSGLLPSTTTLNVRSENNDWLYPVNTESTIYSYGPGTPSDISYDFMVEFPSEICYDNNGGNTGSFIVQPSLFGIQADSYEWLTDAGTIPSSTTTFPATTIQFNNPGTNRFVRVRAINACGASPWLTKYFDLSYEPFGCSGGIGIGFSTNPELNVYPNPAIDEINIKIEEPVTLSNQSQAVEPKDKYHYMLINNDQRIVHTKTTNSSEYKLPLNKFSDGIYILRVVSPTGIKTQRILIDKAQRK